MKKKAFVSLLFALCLVLCMAGAAHAEAQIDYVSDYAGLLSDTQCQSLNEQAKEVSDEYNFGVFVVIVNDYRSYVNGSMADFAENVFHRYGLGRGQKEEGVILAMSMNERDYDIYAHGDFGNYAFTDYGKQQLANSFLDNFRNNDWMGGFRDFIRYSGDMLEKARNGQPVDTWIPDQTETGPRMTLGKLLVSLGVGCLTGGVTVSGMKRQMKTAIRQTGAANYVGGGVDLYVRRDDFVNRSVTRQVIPRQTGGGRPGGGHFGGTTISGGHGGSHSGGKF
ncbi:MAG: TPM domain-containing protein [Oscillospiraceae bacterium]|nr:TPM domain-containing protein [Oscillospiraceae bacterium]